MIFKNIFYKYYLLFFFQAYLGVIYSEILYSYELSYARVFKLYNGNIVMAGDKGINTYDNTGTNLLYNYTFDEIQINIANDGYFTNIVQFPKEDNGLVIVLVYHILYILNSEGKFLFKYELNLDIDPKNFLYYSIVPYFFKEDKYHFILGYINSNQKPCLAYYIINQKNNETITNNSYVFDANSSVNYNFGINCGIMNHLHYGNILICFYQNSYPLQIEIKAFKLENKMLEIIPNISCTYNGAGYGLKTFISINKKKSILCYLSSIEYANIGYCAIYDIDKNEFVKYGKYLSQICSIANSYFSFDYFQETKEYIFSCANYQASINLIKFDQNFDIINIESDGLVKNDVIFSIEGCYQINFYSFVFISKDYKLIGSLDCITKSTKLITVPSEFKPETIYTELPYDYEEKKENLESTILSTYIKNSSNKIKSTSFIKDGTQSTSIISDIIKSTSITKDGTQSIPIISDKITITSNIIGETQSMPIISDKITPISSTIELQSTSIIADKIINTTITKDEAQSLSGITDKINSTIIIGNKIKSTSIITDKITPTSITIDGPQTTSIIENKINSTLIIDHTIESTSIISDKIKSQSIPVITDKIDSTSITIGKAQSTLIIIDKIKSTSIITKEKVSSLIEIDKIKSTEISKDKIKSSLIDEIGSTSVKSNINIFPSNTISSLINYSLSSVSLECDGYKDTEGTICSKNVPNGYYIFDVINKILGKCHISCESCYKGPKSGNNNCLSCYENFELNKNNCLYKYNYYYNANQEIIYLLKDQLCPEILPYELVESKECVEYCDNEELINKFCIINDFSGNNFDLITNRIKDFVALSNSTDYDAIIDGNNVVFEVTTTATSNNYYNISSIDFGECENILKKHYNIDYLIVFKIDIKLNNSYSTIVQYEVYSPDKKKMLNLSLCDKSQIDLLVPVYIDEEVNNLYNIISKEGYDIFNENSSFYKDICTPFTTEDGTDILLYDRHNTYYNENIVLCENTCNYVNYNSTTKRAKCHCQVKKEKSKIETVSLNKLGSSILFDIKTLSNIEIIKCYKLTFSKIGQIGNYGSLILITMIIVFIVLVIYFYINEKYSISNILRKALGKKGNPPKKIKTKLANYYLDNLTNSSSKIMKIKDKNNNTKIPSLYDLKLIDDNISPLENKKKNKANKLSLKIKNYQNINIINKANIHIECKNPKRFSCISNLKKPIKKNSSLEPLNINKIKEKLKDYKASKKRNSIIKNKSNRNYNNNQSHNKHYKKLNYNDEELNTLPYKEALLIDKRTYFEYYWSLLKKKHIILFIFMPVNDYNLITIKLGLFIFSFCLYLTVNALFFTDKTMHKIYEDKGIFNILFQLPQILYSTLISTVINMIIKILALSEKDVIKLRQTKNKSKSFEKSYKLFKWLIVKFNLFFFISLFLLMIFWYYISTFCAVYKNTQKILIKNTFTSFGLTLLYPFGLYLFPGFFRIPSLNTPKKDRECMYKIGNILSKI